MLIIMNREPEFAIGLSNDAEPHFLVYDRGVSPAHDARLRAALESHRDLLAQRLDAVQRLLSTTDPETTERLMIEGSFHRIERIVIRARNEERLLRDPAATISIPIIGPLRNIRQKRRRPSPQGPTFAVPSAIATSPWKSIDGGANYRAYR
jgi:hypothetical protein